MKHLILDVEFKLLIQKAFKVFVDKIIGCIFSCEVPEPFKEKRYLFLIGFMNYFAQQVPEHIIRDGLHNLRHGLNKNGILSFRFCPIFLNFLCCGEAVLKRQD
ncbi:hypothetical protein ES703_82403 [subsurface metagenome]